MSVYDTDKIFNAYGRKIDAEKWMQERIILFEKYCLPSIERQTNKNFTWLLAFDKKTPEHIYKKYEKYSFIKIIFEFPAVYLRNLYGNEIKDNVIIITTRLDNDDCVAPTFIEEIQKRNEDITKLVDSLGCQYDCVNDKWYILNRPFANSAFLSVIEKVGENKDIPIKTCYFKPHQNMHLNFTNEWINEILYCQVLHGDNLGNKIDGILTDKLTKFF
jgi:hypothetical protein